MGGRSGLAAGATETFGRPGRTFITRVAWNLLQVNFTRLKKGCRFAYLVVPVDGYADRLRDTLPSAHLRLLEGSLSSLWATRYLEHSEGRAKSASAGRRVCEFGCWR